MISSAAAAAAAAVCPPQSHTLLFSYSLWSHLHRHSLQAGDRPLHDTDTLQVGPGTYTDNTSPSWVIRRGVGDEREGSFKICFCLWALGMFQTVFLHLKNVCKGDLSTNADSLSGITNKINPMPIIRTK